MDEASSRREFLRVIGAAAAGAVSLVAVEPARATPAAMQQAIAQVAGAARVRRFELARTAKTAASRALGWGKR